MREITETSIAQSLSRHRLSAIMDRLFHDLRKFMRAHAMTPEEDKALPRLNLVWVSGVGGDDGPDSVVLSSIRSNPELWAAAIPDECIIVPRDALRKMIGTDVADALAMHGAAWVGNYAALFRAQRETGKWRS